MLSNPRMGCSLLPYGAACKQASARADHRYKRALPRTMFQARFVVGVVSNGQPDGLPGDCVNAFAESFTHNGHQSSLLSAVGAGTVFQQRAGAADAGYLGAVGRRARTSDIGKKSLARAARHEILASSKVAPRKRLPAERARCRSGCHAP